MHQTSPAEASLANGEHPDRPVRSALARYERFLIPALILFVLGNGLSYCFPQGPLSDWQVAGPLLLCLLGLISYTPRPWLVRLALWLMFFLLGGLYYPWRHFEPGPQDASHRAPALQAGIEATVAEQKPGKNQAILSVQRLNGQPATGQALFYEPVGLKESLQPGDRLQLVADLTRPHSASIPGNFDQTRYLKGQHITAVVQHASQVQFLTASPSPCQRLLRLTAGLRSRITETFKTALPSPQSEILGGLVLGDRAVPVDADTRADFIDTGLIHVLAASGLNVGIIAGAMLLLLTRLKVPYRPRIVLALLAVLFYSLLTGLPPSIVRATAMLSLAFGLKLVRRELSPLLLLCIAVTLLVIINPDQLASIGFQFSVLTTFGLIAMIPAIEARIERPALRWAAGLILIPLVAQLWITPLSVFYFNRLPLQSIPLNVVALALVTPLTILGFTAGVLSLLWQTGATWLASFAHPLLSALLWLVDWGSHWEGAQLQLPSPQPWLILSCYGILLIWLCLLLSPPPWPARRIAALGLTPVLLLALFLGIQITMRPAELEFLPLAEGRHAILLRPAQSDQTLALLPANLLMWEAKSVSDALKHRNIQVLSAVIPLPADLPRNADADSATGMSLLEKRVAVQHRLAGLSGNPTATRDIRWDNLQILLNGAGLQLNRHGQCLLSWQRTVKAGSPCAAQQVNLPSQRLLGPAPLIDQQVQRLSLFESGSRWISP